MQFVPGSWRPGSSRSQLRPLQKGDPAETAAPRPNTSSGSLGRAASDAAMSFSTADLDPGKSNSQPKLKFDASAELTKSLVWTQSDLIEVCEEGFGKCMRALSTEMLTVMQEEMKQTTVAFRQEVATCLKALEGARQESVNVILGEMRSASKTAREENLGAQRELHRCQLANLETQKEMLRQNQQETLDDLNQRNRDNHVEVSQWILQRLDDLKSSYDAAAATLHRDQALNDKIDSIRNAIDVAMQQQGSSGASQVSSIDEASKELLRSQTEWQRHEVSKIMQVTESLKQEISELSTTLCSDTDEKAKQLLKMHDANDKRHAEILNSMETQFDKHLSEKTVKVEMIFSDIISQIGKTHSSVNADVGVVLGEIGRIQKAMHMDYVTDLSGYNLRPGKRVREVSAQTDAVKKVATTTAETQTNSVVVNHEGAQTDQTGAPKMPQVPPKKKKKKPMPKPRAKLVVGPPPEVKPVHVFADAEQMKQKARVALVKPQFAVSNYYWRTGYAQALARSNVFENVTFVVILCNAIWIAVDLDHNDADVITQANPVFVIAENLFCSYFTFEVMVRFMAFERKRDCLLDNWLIFDSVLVFLMVVETWVIAVIVIALDSDSGVDFLGNLSLLRIVRLVKLARMARLARLLRMIPELVILVKSIFVASRSVIFVFLLWILVIYLYAMIFRSITDGEDIGKRYFESVPDAMNTLLLNCVLPDIANIVNDMSGSKAIMWPLMLSFILLTTLTIANMLVGVLVGVVGAVADTEKEAMTVSSLAYDLRTTMYSLHMDPKRILDKAAFEAVLVDPNIASVVRQKGVDVVALVDMSEMIFENSEVQAKGGLAFEDFIDIVLSMRGGNPATVKDIKEHHKSLKILMNDLSFHMEAKLANEIHELRKCISEHMAELRETNLELMTLNSSSEDEDELLESDEEYRARTSSLGSVLAIRSKKSSRTGKPDKRAHTPTSAVW